MKPKHIERKIRGKMIDWWQSIDDVEVRKCAQKGSIVTGGAIVSLLRDERPNDYDVYFKDLETAQKIAEYYVEKFNKIPNNAVNFSGASGHQVHTYVWIKESEDAPKRLMVSVKSAGIAGAGAADKSEYTYFEGVDPDEQASVTEDYVAAATDIGDEIPDFEPVFMTSNAITLSGGVQLVIRFYGTPAEVHENFDYEHCKNYWCSWNKSATALTLRKKSLVAIMTNELVYSGGSKYPLASLFRLRKFMKRGWYYTLGTMLKIVFDLRELNLEDPEVLEEQLIGMDVAYFNEVIERIKRDKPSAIDATYLHTVIDELY